MVLNDLPQLKTKLEEFEKVGSELLELVEQYASCGMNPLTTNQTAYVVAGVQSVRDALAEE